MKLFLPSGRVVPDLTTPCVDDIDISDIAHNLSRICRFNGSTKRFYSVAEHSVWVSRSLPDEHKFEGLLHDAAEAYVGDVLSPLKNLLPGFRQIEARWHDCVAERFGVPRLMSPEVHAVDQGIVQFEAWELLMASPAELTEQFGPPPSEPLGIGLAPDRARNLFLKEFAELSLVRQVEGLTGVEFG